MANKLSYRTNSHQKTVVYKKFFLIEKIKQGCLLN